MSIIRSFSRICSGILKPSTKNSTFMHAAGMAVLSKKQGCNKSATPYDKDCDNKVHRFNKTDPASLAKSGGAIVNYEHYFETLQQERLKNFKLDNRYKIAFLNDKIKEHTDAILKHREELAQKTFGKTKKTDDKKN